jgi:hypothetical protein
MARATEAREARETAVSSFMFGKEEKNLPVA